MRLAALAAPLAIVQASIATSLAPPPAAPACARELVVLGAGQDAGSPQIGKFRANAARLSPASIAVIDREAGQRFLFDATPDITRQLWLLDGIEPPARGSEARLGLDGVFLTHAHIGHYLGLAWFGREAANTQGVPVFAMPRMAAFLRENGPWSQLVETGNIELNAIDEGDAAVVTDGLSVVPILVPHRDEFSETVGFVVITPERRALYLPDLDSWDAFEAMSGTTLEDLVAGVDYALLDATFWDDDELGGRDMSAIPHPRVRQVMDRLQHLPANQRAKVHFIHYNHTNPIRDPRSVQSREVEERGFYVARGGMRLCLSDGED